MQPSDMIQIVYLNSYFDSILKVNYRGQKIEGKELLSSESLQSLGKT